MLANAKAQNKPGSVAGYIIRGKATNPVVADFLPILWSQGGDVFDENWNVVLDNAASKAAISFLVNDLKGVAQADPGEHRRIGPRQDHGQRPGLAIIGLARRDQYRGARPGRTKVAGKVTFIPIPKGTSGKGVGMMGNWLLGVPKASKNQQAAADFIKWMLQKDTQMTYAKNNGIPSRTSVLKDSQPDRGEPVLPCPRGCPPGPAELAPADGSVERRGDDHRNPPQQGAHRR